MIKKILITLMILLLGAGSYLYWTYSTKKTLITPYPYSFNDNAKNALKNDLPEAQSAKILIVGDQMGEALSKYTPEIIDELAKNIKDPLKIYNWSRPHEGLHRTLFKLKSLEKFPSIIIYHGTSSQLFEKTFEIEDSNAIFKNFRIYDDEKIISLIITFPWLSKIIYKKMNYVELGAIKENPSRLPSTQKILEKEVSFKLFQYELMELINLVKDKKSNLILITTPINLEIRPKEVCSHSTTNDIVEIQQEIDELIKEGNYKSAYTKALELSNATPANALSFYLLGKASLGIGDLSLARESFQKAAVFDCVNWRGNAVYNSIMRAYANKHQLPLIDFDQYVSSALSKNELFIDELFPQTIFYQTIVADLKENLKKILSVD